MLGSRNQCDPRVKRVLDQIAYKYTIESEGDFKLIFDLGEGRSQTAFIDSATERFAELEIREVWSVGFIANELPGRKLANWLLRDNANVKIGSWRVKEHSDGRVFFVFATQVSANADAETLQATLCIVSEKADYLENTLGQGEDQL